MKTNYSGRAQTQNKLNQSEKRKVQKLRELATRIETESAGEFLCRMERDFGGKHCAVWGWRFLGYLDSDWEYYVGVKPKGESSRFALQTAKAEIARLFADKAKENGCDLPRCETPTKGTAKGDGLPADFVFDGGTYQMPGTRCNGCSRKCVGKCGVEDFGKRLAARLRATADKMERACA